MRYTVASLGQLRSATLSLFLVQCLLGQPLLASQNDWKGELAAARSALEARDYLGAKGNHCRECGLIDCLLVFSAQQVLNF